MSDDPKQTTKCPGNDPGCPCQDGDACHYCDLSGSPAMAPKPTADVSLDVWLADAHKRLDDFASSWRVGNVGDPEGWPMAMPMREWDEQYRCADGG